MSRFTSELTMHLCFFYKASNVS